MARSYAANPLLTRLQEDLNRLFKEALELSGESLGVATGFPRIDIVESAESILVIAEVPGLGAADVSVEVEGDRLTLRGVREPARAAERTTFHCVERARGPFARSVKLPVPVDGRRASARLAEGLLEVRIPRVREQRRRHRITVLEPEKGEAE